MLYILPSCLVQELATILPLTNLVKYVPSTNHNCIRYYFHLQLMLSSSTWKDSYVADKDTTIIMQYLLYHQSFEQVIIPSLPAQYRSSIVNNTLCIVEGRHVLYEIVPKNTKNSFVF